MKKRGRLQKLVRLASSKKGSEAAETSEVNIGQLLVSILQILIFVFLIVGIYSLTRKAFADQGTEESFYDLVFKLQALDKGEFPEGIGHSYYIEKGLYLYGFNSQTEDIGVTKDIGIDKNRVRKPNKPGCQSGKSCVCICNKNDCSDYAACNARLIGGKPQPIIFNSVESFYVTGDPDNKLNKGSQFNVPGVGSVNYLAISGNNWRQGKVLYLMRRANAVEISFKQPPDFGKTA